MRHEGGDKLVEVGLSNNFFSMTRKHFMPCCTMIILLTLSPIDLSNSKGD